MSEATQPRVSAMVEAAISLLDAQPRTRIASLPTPLRSVPRLAAALGLRRELLFKHDDLTGSALGGNKIRKLEFLLADARREGADTLVTVGAGQSNHARATALAGVSAGFKVHLVLGDGADQAPEGNLVLDRLAGATLHVIESADWNTLAEAMADVSGGLQRQGCRPYCIPIGGSTPVGALGYALAYCELLGDLDSRGVRADWIVHASSTGGTQAGLVAGRTLTGQGPAIFGVDVAKGGPGLGERILALAEAVLDRLGSGQRVEADAVRLSDFTGPAYGSPTKEAIAAMRTAARTEGLVLDPVYTAKALGALPALEAAERLPGTGAVVFLHTGGHPALFARRYSESVLEESVSA